MKKPAKTKIRRTWLIKPITKVKESAKVYKREKVNYNE
jgi:hypothetical protein